MKESEVRILLSVHGIEAEEITRVIGSFSKEIFLIDGKIILRSSSSPMDREIHNFTRVKSLPFVPSVHYTGAFDGEDGKMNYAILDLLPGKDLIDVYSLLSLKQQLDLGKDIASFLDALHSIRGTNYDIGHYVPTVPSFIGSWKDGHIKYWGQLNADSIELPLGETSRKTVGDAFDFLYSSVAALSFQQGPRVLHNDFHPKNILVDHGHVSGVIDWECAQFGEVDFELSHLIHWCAYPPEQHLDLRPLIKSICTCSPLCTQVPDLSKRLTIYQIEHEINQLIWSEGKAENIRIPRIKDWMEGKVARFLAPLPSKPIHNIIM